MVLYLAGEGGWGMDTGCEGRVRKALRFSVLSPIWQAIAIGYLPPCFYTQLKLMTRKPLRIT